MSLKEITEEWDFLSTHNTQGRQCTVSISQDSIDFFSNFDKNSQKTKAKENIDSFSLYSLSLPCHHTLKTILQVKKSSEYKHPFEHNVVLSLVSKEAAWRVHLLVSSVFSYLELWAFLSGSSLCPAGWTLMSSRLSTSPRAAAVQSAATFHLGL